MSIEWHVAIPPEYDHGRRRWLARMGEWRAAVTESGGGDFELALYHESNEDGAPTAFGRFETLRRAKAVGRAELLSRSA